MSFAPLFTVHLVERFLIRVLGRSLLFAGRRLWEEMTNHNRQSSINEKISAGSSDSDPKVDFGKVGDGGRQECDQ